MGKKIPVGIIGTGNIGTDLLVKIARSQYLECVLFSGQNKDSPGIARAKSMGIPTSTESIDAFKKAKKKIAIVFDATSAAAHRIHAPILKQLGMFAIDLTPSKVGAFCVPMLNLKSGIQEKNVNMVSCGGQANSPIIFAILSVHPETPYVEIVSSIASQSAGIGTRNNIDEYTQTTSDGIMELTGATKTKTIIILNPSDPPIHMHNTIYAQIENPNIPLLTKRIQEAEKKLQAYVPGFSVTLGPVFENNRLTVMSEVIGRGDFLPTYAGNLDIINCAAIAVAEAYAKRKSVSKS